MEVREVEGKQMERDVCEVRRRMDCDGLRWERKERINRGEQVGEIDATGVHVYPLHHMYDEWL